MSDANATRARRGGLKTEEFIPGLLLARRKTHWFVSDSSPKSADDLSFTRRDSEGRINWWSVQPPKTDYFHAHQVLGLAYAYEVLDLVNNPEAEVESAHTLGFILGAIARWLPSVSGTAATGLADGFFDVVSEYVATGTADR